MGVLLQICCIFSEYLFLRTPLDGCLYKFRSVHLFRGVFRNLSNIYDGAFCKIFKPNSHVRTFCRKSLRLKPYSFILFFTLKFYVHVRGGSRLQIRLRQSSVIKAPISFLNMHKLLWKSKILVHGHVRIFLNFVTFPLIVLIKIVQVITQQTFVLMKTS